MPHRHASLPGDDRRPPSQRHVGHAYRKPGAVRTTAQVTASVVAATAIVLPSDAAAAATPDGVSLARKAAQRPDLSQNLLGSAATAHLTGKTYQAPMQPLVKRRQDTATHGAGPRRQRQVPAGWRLPQRFATSALRSIGIGRRSSGGCSNRTRSTCTSFDGLRGSTLNGLIALKLDSGCPVVVSGGTERGHAAGRYSHWNGYKIDVVPNPCLDRWIRRYPHVGTRGDGAGLYRSREGTTFARETGHWDITFR